MPTDKLRTIEDVQQYALEWCRQRGITEAETKLEILQEAFLAAAQNQIYEIRPIKRHIDAWYKRYRRYQDKQLILDMDDI